MWAHYGSFHRGLCIEFDLDEHDPNLDTQPQRVRYSNHRPRVSAADLTLPKHSGAEYLDVVERVLLTKCVDWSYENEWRCISIGSPGAHDLGGSRVVGLTVGARMSVLDRI